MRRIEWLMNLIAMPALGLMFDILTYVTDGESQSR